MPIEKEIEAGAKMLCFMNMQYECTLTIPERGWTPCTPETCPYGLRDYKEEATAVLKAAEKVRNAL